jgi:peptide/nickel transport system substrate-binding protein
MVTRARSARVGLLAALLPLLAGACQLVPGSREGGGRAPETMTIALRDEVDSLDPHKKDALISIGVLSNVYEPLVFTDAEMRIRPVLALSWENPDPLTWIFRLRSDVVFHGGQRLTAADVVYALERARTGALEMKTYLSDVVRIQARDEHTVEVRTRRPDRIFLRRVAFVPIVRGGATVEGLESTPDGTGAFAVTDWKKDETLALRRHERYHGARPALREVRFRFGVTTDSALEGLRSNTYQLAQADAKTLRAMMEGQGRYHVLQAPSVFVQYLGYDLGREVTPFCSARPNPFKDPRVRQALDLAIDRQVLVSALSTDALPASQLVPRLVFGHNPRIRPAAHDLVTAKALLRAAGLGAGFQVVLHARPFYAEVAASVKVQLRAVGIEVEPRLLSGAEYYEAAQRRNMSFWIGAFGCTSGDASELLSNVIHSRDDTGSRGALNISGYANPVLDRAIDASGAIDDLGRRGQALEQLMHTVTEERVGLPLCIAQDGFALERRFRWRPRADGFIRAAEMAPAP